ncbi:hypothetical protein LNP02_28885 [Klebsiella variicola subsp. variicola]|nr:hypothetical protein [Klebsiella variicola subsp. variicola]
MMAKRSQDNAVAVNFNPILQRIFVNNHGDRPQDRWSEGGYILLVNFLISQGIAVFSGDKPGVGQSTGNWLAQTMSDRSEEAVIALQKLREQPELKNSRGGYLGFSQAGWVVPLASS